MTPNLQQIQDTLKEILRAHTPPLQVRKDNAATFEVAGTKPVMQGKQKVDGYYFASIVPKPKDIRWYFFPIYTHAAAFNLSDDLKKSLKGKSCFHIKQLTPEVEREIGEMVNDAVKLYRKEDLI